MSFAAVGSIVQTSTSSLSLNPQNVGDLFLVEVLANSSASCTSISGGGCTWTQVGTTLVGSVNASWTASVFAGKVTAAGSATATLTLSGSPSNLRVAGQEFSTTAGTWVLDSQGNLDNAGTSALPSLTPAGSGELYFGFFFNVSNASAGSTSGYTYTADSHGNDMIYNPACTGAIQSPTTGDSGNAIGIAVLMKEGPALASSMTVTGTFPANDWNDGCFTSAFVLTGAKVATGQTGVSYGTPSGSSDSSQKSITTTTTGSWVVGAYSDPGNANSSPTMLSNTIEVTNYANSGAGIDFLVFRPQSATGTPGATTYGADASASGFLSGTIAMAEVLPSASGTISLDSSSPSTLYADTGASNTSTTVSFAPVSGSLLFAVVAADANPGHSAGDIQISDSVGLTWHQLAFGNGSNGMIAALFVADVPSGAPSGAATSFLVW